MDWFATDSRGQRWHPYVVTPPNGAHEVLMHHEGDDTDMGDLTMSELVDWHGTLTITTTRSFGKIQLPRPRPANYIEQETE